MTIKGSNGEIFFMYLLCGSHDQNSSAWSRPAQELLPVERLEHDGLHRRCNRFHNYIYLERGHQLRLANIAGGARAPTAQARLGYTQSSGGTQVHNQGHGASVSDRPAHFVRHCDLRHHWPRILQRHIPRHLLQHDYNGEVHCARRGRAPTLQ